MRAQIVSGLITFVSNFLTVLATVIIAVPSETWTSPNTYTTSFFSSLVLTAVRQALVKPLVESHVRK